MIDAGHHPFADGNKRTAFFSALVFLSQNGVCLEVGASDAAEFMYAVARGDLSSKKVADWIRERRFSLES